MRFIHSLIALCTFLLIVACTAFPSDQSSQASQANQSNQPDQSSAIESATNPYCMHHGKSEELRCAMAQAQRAKDLPRVEQLATDYARSLGSQAGMPELENPWEPVHSHHTQLTSDQIRTAFRPYVQRLEQEAWWLSQPAPTEISKPLRFLASVISGNLAARRAGAENPEKLLQMAEGAAEYLLLAQTQSRHDLFPFPNMQNARGRPAEAAEQFLDRAAAMNKLSDVLVNNWIVDDLGGGDLQFDNGVAGVAMIELYEATRNRKYLDAARRASDWAMSQPTVPNWNYNSFSVYLLCQVYRVTGEDRYLESAREKARLGIYPGQLKAGHNQGHWADPHNARLNYHYILIRGLGTLVAVLPDGDPDLPRALEVLSLALQVGNAEIISKNSVTYPQETLEALSRLQLILPEDRPIDAGRTQALETVGRYVITQFQNRQLVVLPDAWGLFLETRS